MSNETIAIIRARNSTARLVTKYGRSLKSLAAEPIAAVRSIARNSGGRWGLRGKISDEALLHLATQMGKDVQLDRDIALENQSKLQKMVKTAVRRDKANFEIARSQKMAAASEHGLTTEMHKQIKPLKPRTSKRWSTT